MAQVQPWPKLLRDSKGIHVRTTRAIETGAMVIPEGAIGIVSGGHSWNRLHFQSEPCTCCGVMIRVSRLHRSDLEPI